MAAMNNEYLERFEETLKGWTDERFITRADIRTLAMFNLYLVNLSEGDGWVYDGHSFKVGSPMCTLVVRGSVDGVPHVVFSSGRTTTACMRAFLRKLAEGWLEWQVDKYRR